jgi:FkbM family methyltransferase
MTEIASIRDESVPEVFRQLEERSNAAENPRSHPDLVYDVGMHRGEDTAFYLAMGFRVVAFEANPELAAQCRSRFAAELADDRLTIVEGAIAEPGIDHVEFYRDPEFSAWGTIDGDWVSRRENLADFELVSVRAVDFSAALRTHGIPHFMKIDIEGADRLCLDALAAADSRPQYLSIESEKFSVDELNAEFDLLEALGYKRFAMVQQANIRGRLLRTTDRLGKPLEYRFERDASGAFGVDVGPWIDRAAALRRYRSIFRAYRMFGEGSWLRRFRIGRIVLARLPRYTGKSLPGWYDTHAMLVE